jgi:hypothetical protein
MVTIKKYLYSLAFYDKPMTFSKDKTIVLKIGSAVLCTDNGKIDEKVIKNICDNIAALIEQNILLPSFLQVLSTQVWKSSSLQK